MSEPSSTVARILGLAIVWAFSAGSSESFAAEYLIGRSEHDPLKDKPLVAGRIYDGSTAEKVDEFLRNVPENSTITFGNHLFETHGVWDNWLQVTRKGFRVKRGWTIQGKGTNSTTGTVIKLIDVPVDATRQYEHNAVFSTGGIGLHSVAQPANRRPNVDDVTIRDLQIDCNYPELAKTKGKDLGLNGIQLLGNRNIRIENVWIRRSVSRKYGVRGINLEGFPVYVYNPWAAERPGNYHLERVAITEFGGGYVSAICVNGNATGIIQNCYVDLESDSAQRYGLNFAAGINRFTIRSNVVINATRGINNDTGPVCTNVLIANNQFLQCHTGLLLAVSRDNHVISNNFTLTGGGSGIAIRYHPGIEHVQSGACVVRENTFSGPGGEGITLAYRNEYDAKDLTLHWSSNNIIQNNVFFGELQSKIPPRSIALNTVRPGNRRHVLNYEACKPGQPANVAAIGFPSDIGPGTDCSYCDAKASESSFGFISRVRLRGTRMDMQSDWGDGSGYTDFTTGYAMGVGATRRQRAYQAQWADVRRGQVYAMEIEASALGPTRLATFHAYIDFDHDGVFHRDRELVATAQGRRSVDMNIAVPSSVPLGSTRMRLVMAGSQSPDPCAKNDFWGEIEDYTITIMP